MPHKDEDKVFDVAKPGAGEPSKTSRPVIVGHKNMIEDPMVKAPASATLDADAADEDTADPTKVKKEETEEIKPSQAKTVEPPAELTAAAEPPEAPPAPEPAKEAEPPKPAESASDSLPKETPKEQPKESELSEEEKAQQAAIQKLIEDKQYVVHIGEHHHRKLDKKILIGLTIAGFLLIVFAAYLLK